MVEIHLWMESLKNRLLEQFGSRLLFLGVQGSYGRGEAGPDSDIDAVTILDQVELEDLDAYRAIVVQLPEGECACGFLCGRSELQNWPKYDLLQLVQDTRGVYGTLEGLIPPLGRAALAESVAIGASGLYHAACHTYLYAPKEAWSEFLNEAHKSAFFVLRALHELRAGERVRTKRDLLARLSGEEREILRYSLLPDEQTEEQNAVFARLIRWASSAMAEAQS